VVSDFGPEWEAADRIARAIRRRWGLAAGYPFASGRDQRATAVLFDLLGLEVSITPDDRRRLRVTGWDRDLTSRVLPSEIVMPEDLGSTLDALRSELDALVPTPYRRAFDAAIAGEPRGVSGVPVGTAEGPDAAFASADLARLEGLIHRQWADAEVAVAVDAAHQSMLTCRPYGTYRMAIGFEQHLHVAAGVYVEHIAVPKVFGRWLQCDPDEHAIAMSLAAMEDWYRLAEPTQDVLDLPLLDPAIRITPTGRAS
jgi:hypothetical protein